MTELVSVGGRPEAVLNYDPNGSSVAMSAFSKLWGPETVYKGRLPQTDLICLVDAWLLGIGEAKKGVVVSHPLTCSTFFWHI